MGRMNADRTVSGATCECRLAAERLREAHQRVRRVTREGRLAVEPQLPVDLLGFYVLMPVPGGVVE